MARKKKATTIALLSDVHGNLPALEAVLADAAENGAEQVWNLGDFLGYAPFPNEVVDRLRTDDTVNIVGNYDLKVLEFPEKQQKWKRKKTPAKYAAFEWNHERLTEGARRFLAALPEQRRLTVNGLDVLLVHGSPVSVDELLDSDTPEARFAELAEAARADVVLCGHSYGGMVITGVADRMPERISALVYLDALVPEDGQSMFDTIPDAIADGFRAQAAAGDGHSVPPMTAEQFNVNEADSDWMNRKCTNHPLASFTEPLKLTGRHRAVAHRVYVLAAGFEHPGTRAAFELVKAKPGWKTEIMQGGHDLMLDNPDAVVEVLLACD